jgi:hypothetical protein
MRPGADAARGITRVEVVEALEVAVVLLLAADPAAGRQRSAFIDLLAIDPGLVERGRGRHAAQILGGVAASLRERDGQDRAPDGAAPPASVAAPSRSAP